MSNRDKAEAKKAKVKANKAKVKANKTKVKAYKAKVKAYKAKVKAYKANIDSTDNNYGSVNDLKNRLRGYVANYKSKKFIMKKYSTPQVEFKKNIKILLLDARKHLKPHLIKDFITWTQEQVDFVLTNAAQNEVGYDDLQGLYEGAPSIDLEKELYWVAHKVLINKEQINSYINAMGLIEANTFSGNYTGAIDEVDLLNDNHGVSIWSIKLKIALLQVSKGLEEQKKYTSEVRQFFKGTILDYITFNTSIKNEIRTTLSKHIVDVNRQVKRSDLSDDTKAYLKYSLISEFPNKNSDLAGILKTEQNYSLIDVYSTFISILQHLYKDHLDTNNRRLLQKLLVLVADIKDYRLDKLRLYLGDKFTNGFYNRDTLIPDELFSGQSIKALKSFNRVLRNSSTQDPWHVIYASLAYSSKSKAISQNTFKPHELYKSIGQIFQDKCDVYTQTLNLNKALTNFGGLPLSGAIVDFLNIVFNTSSTRNWSFKHVGLNTPYYGVEDGAVNATTTTSQVWNCEVLPSKISNFIYFYSSLSFVINSIERKNFNSALTALKELPEAYVIQPLLTMKKSLELHCLFELDQKEDIVELISCSCNSTNNLNGLLPIKSALEFFDYEDFILPNNLLAGPITLFNLWARNDSSDTLSYLRIMTKSTLKKLGATKPSELTFNMVSVNKESFVFFLENICVPQVIDIIRSIKGTKAVLLERQAICQNLIELNPSHKSDYATEMLDIEHELQMSEGKRMVDGTRIYVDMDALIRWSQKEMRDEFNRYRDIVKVKINCNDQSDFDDSLIEYTTALDGVQTNLTADNEADALLFTMVNKISYEFLTNSSFGLDYYLSKRIRHQSFIGLIRSHYEFSNLITSRENRNKDYDYNHDLVNKFTSLDQNDKNKLNKTLTGFAQKFDDKLFEARDKKFHVKSKEHPEGLIGIEYNSLMIGLLKQYLEPCKTLEEFLESINVILWAILNHSLQRTRDFISDTLKIEVANYVDQLKANVQKIASRDSFYLDFETTLSHKSSDVQRALDEVVCWFTPIEPSDLNTSFSLKQILQIAVNGVLRLHKAFKPDVELVPTYNDTIELHSDNLTLINDTLFILFDNVKEHSGIKKPKIKIKVDTDEEGVLGLVFVSESKSSLRKKQEEELLKITDIISRKAFGTRTKQEGKSGIIKLAAAVDEIPKAKLNYGFNEDSNFEVALKYPLVFETQSVGE